MQFCSKTKQSPERSSFGRSSSALRHNPRENKYPRSFNDTEPNVDTNTLRQLLAEVSASNSYKNELFLSTNKTVSTLQAKIEDKVNELNEYLRTLKTTNSSVAGRAHTAEDDHKYYKFTPTKKNPKYPSPELASPPEEKHQRSQTSPGVNAHRDKSNSYEKRNKKRTPSPPKKTSPKPKMALSKTKSISAEKKGIDKELYFKSPYKLHDKNETQENDIQALVSELKKKKKFYEEYGLALDQKLLKLGIDARKLLLSSSKMASIVQRKNETEADLLKTFQHDYNLLDDSLNKLGIFKNSSKEKQGHQVRSFSQESKRPVTKGQRQFFELQKLVGSSKKPTGSYFTLEDDPFVKKTHVKNFVYMQDFKG